MKYAFANWKMYLDFDESCILANRLAAELCDFSKVKITIFPNFLAITDVEKVFRGTPVSVGGQNCSWTPKGAYTGAVSAHLLKEAGCEYVLVGHSERRHIFGESNQDVRDKLEAAIDVGLTPVLCVGETEEDRNMRKTEYRLKKQLMKALENLHIGGGKLIIAYEPVWAIGTDNPCGPDDADDIHGWIKMEIKQYVDKDIPVLYGGSVNSENVLSYVSRGIIDGVLVGSSSIKYDAWLSLIRKIESL